MRFFRVRGPNLWGDYGDILIGGMSAHLPRRDGLIQLERTGPFVPPIFFPEIGDVIVADTFRTKLERHIPTGLSFQPVLKARIVEYLWHLWDRSSPEPAEYPEDGEPESYILARPHSALTADQLGPLWELLLSEDSETETVKVGRGVFEFRIRRSSWHGTLFFRPSGKRHVVATELMKAWLEENAGEWVAFAEMVVVD